MKNLEAQNKNTPKNIKRRKLLTTFLFGGFAVLLGRTLHNLSDSHFYNKGVESTGGLSVKETTNGLALHDKDGNEILVVQNS